MLIIILQNEQWLYPVIFNALHISFGALKFLVQRDILPIRQTSVIFSWNKEPDLIFQYALFPVTIKK